MIQPGSDADLLIIDPDAGFHHTRQRHHSTTGYTPYEDREVQGKPWMTMLRGRVVLNQGKLEQKPGYGQFIAAEGPTLPSPGG